MSITTLSRQGAGIYRLSGLGIGLVSALLCVGGIAPPTPPSPAPTPIPPIIEPVAPVVPPRVPSASAAAGGGGGGVSWRFEGTPYERRARVALVAPVGRMAASGAIVLASVEAPEAVPSVRRMARLAGMASAPMITASGYVFNIARHNAAARRVLDEDEDDDTRLED